MAAKLSLLHLLIYLAMAAWVGALAAYAGRLRRIGLGLFACGFAVLCGALALRWAQVRHPPLQNLFEVFLCLGALMFPLWLFCQKFLKARAPAGAVLIGLAVLVPPGFVFAAQPQHLPPALQSWLFVPHVAAYMLAYVVLLLAGVQALLHLAALARGGASVPGAAAQPPHVAPAASDAAGYELATHRLIRLGFPLLLLGLVLGAVWGKLAWGDYWNWDPKELWSLASVLVYVAYLHFRALNRPRLAWVHAALALAGAVVILITLLWVNLDANRFSGMHVYAT